MAISATIRCASLIAVFVKIILIVGDKDYRPNTKQSSLFSFYATSTAKRDIKCFICGSSPLSLSTKDKNESKVSAFHSRHVSFAMHMKSLEIRSRGVYLYFSRLIGMKFCGGFEMYLGKSCIFLGITFSFSL